MLDVQADAALTPCQAATRRRSPIHEAETAKPEGWSPLRKLAFFVAAGLLSWGIVLLPLFALAR